MIRVSGATIWAFKLCLLVQCKKKTIMQCRDGLESSTGDEIKDKILKLNANFLNISVNFFSQIVFWA